MSVTEWDRLKALLAQRDTDPKQLFAAANAVLGLVTRGDCMIGILPVDAIGDVVEGQRRAAKAGLAEARAGLGTTLGVLMDQGLELSEFAASAFAAAAEVGDRGAALMAARLWMDLDDETNARRAIEIVEKHADPDSDGSAHLLLGYMTYRGYGREADAAESGRLHEAAALRGNSDAMFELYVLLSTGQGVPKDEEKALGWCRKAADLGHGRALYNLGSFHATGRGLPKDSKQALAYYLRASEAGNGRASATAGVMLWTGDGADPDEARALELFALASERGFDVEELLDRVGISLD